MSEFVTYDELKAASGYDKPAEVSAWCARMQIPTFKGKRNHPATTKTALNSALGVLPNTTPVQPKDTIEA